MIVKFDGMNLEAFGVNCFKQDEWAGTIRDYSSTSINGRSGDLLVDNKRLGNVTISYDILVKDEENPSIDRKIEGLRDFLTSKKGYCKLWDEMNPDEFYLAAFDSFTVEKQAKYTRACHAVIKFNRKPQRFLQSGNEWVRAVINLKNPTHNPSKPLIRIYGTNGAVRINNSTIRINEFYGSCVEVDTETMNSNANSNVSLPDTDIELCDGNNAITYNGSISKVEVKPRWWRA